MSQLKSQISENSMALFTAPHYSGKSHHYCMRPLPTEVTRGQPLNNSHENFVEFKKR